MIWIPDDNVIEDFDLEKLTGSDEIAGDFDVGFGRRGFAARMIVGDDDGGCARHDCQAKHFTGMTEDCIHCPNGHEIVTLDAAAGIEDEYNQTFTFRIEVRMGGDMRFPIGGCLLWRFARLHGVGCGTFPK